MNPVKLRELRESIAARGLLHPPVVFKREDGKYELVAGERRLTCLDALAKEAKPISCNNTLIEPGTVPVTYVTEILTSADRFELEFEENAHREDLTWQDRTKALAALHSMRKSADYTHTYKATAEEVIALGAATPKVAGETPNTKAVTNAVREAVVLSEVLNDPKIAGARNASEAYSLYLKSEEEKYRAAYARKLNKSSSLSSTPTIEIRHGDMLTLLPSLDDGIADLICTDPPYGIDASSGGFRSRTVHHHDYEDSVEYARTIALSILTEGFRVARPRANLFLFTDIKHWDWLQTVSAQIGWSPFRRPLIWGKSDSEGLAPWGSKGPRITTELIFYATKGQKGLLASPIDYLRVNRVPRHERVHAAEKPVELMRKLLECSTMAGDFVLDPCCGSGSTLVAAKELRRVGLGIERDEGFYNTAMTNLYGETKSEPTVS